MKNLNVTSLLFLSLFAISLVSSSCNKEEELAAFEIVNNNLEGSWDLNEYFINGEDFSEFLEGENTEVSFVKDADDARKGVMNTMEQNVSDSTPYVLSEDGKEMTIEGEKLEILIEGDVLTMTYEGMDEEGEDFESVQKYNRL